MVPTKPKTAPAKQVALAQYKESTNKFVYPNTPASTVTPTRLSTSIETPQTKNAPPKVIHHNRNTDDVPSFNKVYIDNFTPTHPIETQPLSNTTKAPALVATQTPIDTTTTQQTTIQSLDQTVLSGQPTIHRYFKTLPQKTTQAVTTEQGVQTMETLTKNAENLTASEIVQVQKVLLKEIDDLTCRNKELSFNTSFLKARISQLETERNAVQDK